MGRRPLKLDDLVAAGVFDPANFRHRRALDVSQPLEGPALEELRQHALYYRGMNEARVRGGEVLRRFAEAVTDRQK